MHTTQHSESSLEHASCGQGLLPAFGILLTHALQHELTPFHLNKG